MKPPKLPELDARGNEIWRILLRIADHADGDWPERARAAAIELSGKDRRQQDASAAVRLLGHIRDLFPDERMTCAEIVQALNADDQLPYGGWNLGGGITTRELGKKLAPYGVRAKTIRVAGVRGNGYERDQFEDAWSRYLPGNGDSNRDTGTTRMVEPETDETKPGQESFVTVSETPANPHEHSDVTVVTVSKSKYGRNGHSRLGDAMYPLMLAEAVRDGHLTESEAAEQYTLYGIVESSGAVS